MPPRSIYKQGRTSDKSTIPMNPTAQAQAMK